ncbi:MAG: thiamine-phosphate kinase [Chthoniobacterales bacterium]|nr:thiamine-phosphate kinase [Chthoniobacterales bacterium]
MKLSGEDLLLGKILKGLPDSKDLVLGPGDDCAVVRIKSGLLLLKTDCLVENIHFLRKEDPKRAGWKALCRPLSDIAAMGGKPLHALITLFSPPELDPAYWEEFYKGIRKAARKFGVTIAGGEMSRQPCGLAVSVALTGSVSKRFAPRSGGSSGDVLFVTGELGGSLAGHHLDFVPRLKEGQWLTTSGFANAMMDLSDGLGSDLPRLARASGCGFDVHLDRIPLRRGSDVQAGLTDGEDYELLFAVSPNKSSQLVQKWKSAFPRVRLTDIGTLNGTGSAPQNWPGGWDHFTVVRTTRLGQRSREPAGKPRRQRGGQ